MTKADEAMAKQTEYAILVEPLADADGGGWLASVPALPGCMGDGETREAALAGVQNAIAEWKDAAHQLGRDVPGPAALGQWPRSLHEKLKIIAAREGVSLNAYVTSVLAEAGGKKTAQMVATAPRPAAPNGGRK
jgi:predicted RNase H-like HicB family nuclease